MCLACLAATHVDCQGSMSRRLLSTECKHVRIGAHFLFTVSRKLCKGETSELCDHESPSRYLLPQSHASPLLFHPKTLTANKSACCNSPQVVYRACNLPSNSLSWRIWPVSRAGELIVLRPRLILVKGWSMLSCDA